MSLSNISWLFSIASNTHLSSNKWMRMRSKWVCFSHLLYGIECSRVCVWECVFVFPFHTEIIYMYEKRHKYTQKCVYSFRIGSNRMVNLVKEWCVYSSGFFDAVSSEQRNDGMKGIYLERCSHLYIYYHQLQNNERRTSNANSDDAWCWIRANIEVKAIFVVFFLFIRTSPSWITVAVQSKIDWYLAHLNVR